MSGGRPRISLDERFWSQVTIVNGCWLFGGTGRYGKIKTEPPYKKTISAHKYAWEYFFGVVPEGLQVCHRCNVKHCVNPLHLYLGTSKQNINDAIRDGLRKIHGEANPKAKLTWEDANIIRDSSLNTATLSSRYGVSYSTIQRIRNGNTWVNTTLYGKS